MRSGPAVVAALTGALLAACTSHAAQHPVTPSSAAGPPLAVHDAKDARAAVRAGRVVRTLLFDGGALRISPASSSHPGGEAHAIALARSASAAGTTIDVSDVVVGYGLADLGVPVTAKGQSVQPDHLPSFHNRPAWFIVHENGPHSCPAIPAPSAGGNGTHTREPLPVLLIAADGSGEGVSYRSAGSFCGFPEQGPVATPGVYSLSLPWRVASSTASGLTLAVTLPRCSTVSTVSGPGWPDTTIGVSADVMMVRGACPGEPSRPVVAQRPRDGSAPRHAPTGLVRGMMTDTGHFTYFDGASHTIP